MRWGLFFDPSHGELMNDDLHPIEGLLLLCLAAVVLLRPVVVALVALALTIAGYKPTSPRKAPEPPPATVTALPVRKPAKRRRAAAAVA
jgi:hypothetical protein